MLTVSRCELEEREEWRKWMTEIPAIQFPSEWGVKIIPPFAGAIARFWVDLGEAHVSVYLDCYDNLGVVGEPYWEIYPYDDDTYRVLMADVDELVQRIQESLSAQQIAEERRQGQAPDNEDVDRPAAP